MNAPADAATEIRTCRHDGWTADRRRTFLELLAEGHVVEAACAQVGMSKVTAYALRRRDPGFALAWSAAMLCARDAVADMLTSRAIEGQVDTFTRADGTTVTRHRHDNRLGLALLARLDRHAAQPAPSALGDPDQAALRAAACAFDALVDLVGQGELDADAVTEFIEPHIRKLHELCVSDRLCRREEGRGDESRPAHGGEGLSPLRAGAVVPSAPRENGEPRKFRKLRREKDPAHAETQSRSETAALFHQPGAPAAADQPSRHQRGEEGYWRVLSPAELERQREGEQGAPTPPSSP